MKAVGSNSIVIRIVIVSFKRFVVITHGVLECWTIVNLHSTNLSQKFYMELPQIS